MQRKLTILYIFVTGIIAGVMMALETQPALFFIELMAPNPGDSYSIMLVLFPTWFLLMLPLLSFLFLKKTLRKDSQEAVGAERTGVFVTRQKSIQSALIGLPVYINGEKLGVVDNGKTIFFDGRS